ncbi:bifunctional farnesyl-diphosphate farnesyltransferase/squalene synthase [Cadophora gregata]|uniref:bifunctional farnesyl-diphosphate farnesyltransferase/squalene synthase n=1 Tax=Cadophora gregata TaxID=51156 RepID=UPI0026DD9B65|nr:bifunctional farnesyl-diphosphate farnesyltransferase/squalene synthase [Cadophora gregata]KAK0102568.1 bifunctional farnesyl-diphosphate farnesyltransferase/squalene synthase [Cadophora gregata]KAK0104221.1 bifunctional farnesyl-diphosphate farnesyltransferase/squalene synthase [Cadophora gregata f. sp. sojae]
MGVLSQLLYFSVHPNQLRSILQWKIWHEPVHARNPEKESANLRECFRYLEMTSRSFSSVIQELNPELLVPVALFYLILRGLDTIEDDMTIPLETKEPKLRKFQDILEEDGWTFNENGPNEKDRELLVHFDVVIAEFKLVKPAYRDIIKDITNKMGNGMADYANNAEHNIHGVNTIKDYELYCHYVAGLVGDGLTRLFVESKLANPALLKRPELSESMGQFLQKTNIIRDIREDFDDKRRFWPKEIWSKHVTKFDDLFDPKNIDIAINCSSEMVLNSLRHADECLFYMAGIKDQSVFNFVAIPQSMAIATLELVFHNPDIFKKNVKITKGDACQLMMESSQNLRSVCEIFKRYIAKIHKKNTPKDPNYLEISIACAKVEQFIESIFPTQDPKALSLIHKGEIAPSDAKRAAEDSEAKKDVFFLLLAVMGTLAVISGLMIGAAYLAGARFDIALKELTKGNIFPKGGEPVPSVSVTGHGEL